MRTTPISKLDLAPAGGATGLLAATLAVDAGPAGAGPDGEGDRRSRRDRAARQLRVCDPTACYVAWRVVDSDHDGVSDADELMAGTDPHDVPAASDLPDLPPPPDPPEPDPPSGPTPLVPPT